MPVDKRQIRNVLIEHLSAKGWPNLTDQQIVDELKPMWIKLEESQLVQPGWTFNQFNRVAREKLQEIQIMDQLRAFGMNFR